MVRAGAFLLVLSVSAAAVAAASCSEAPGPPIPNAPPAGAEAIAASPQRPGDPAAGYAALLNAPYVSCGIPASLIDGKDLSAALPVIGFSSNVITIDDREPQNEDLPYFLTRVTAPNGVELVSTNCLSCHANEFQGQLVIGLGNANIDTTGDIAQVADFIDSMVTSPADKAAYAEWRDRMKTLAPHVHIDTMGLTAADNLAIELYGRRDPVTLEWKGDYQIDVPADVFPVPVATPPWWRMKKQTAMFSSGSFRGDHARFMDAASSLCIDSMDESLAIDSYFPDVRAYIESLDAPKYPFPIDADLAGAGERVFVENCSGCHGTYGKDGYYPNLVIPLDEVKTDPELHRLSSELVAAVGPWLAKTYFASTNSFVDTKGYLAPPLDGVWITAPYLHNDSVPTLETLLDSKKRPTYFTRSFYSDDFDPKEVGFSYTVETSGKVDGDFTVPNRQKYDTTRPGYGNGGHTYGDALTPLERSAVIEYLKTL